MENETSSTQTKHARISEYVRSLLTSGRLGPGQRIPSETRLSGQFQATRATVARALKDLEAEGLIVRRRGSGSFVCEPPRGSKPMTFGLLVPGLGETEIFEPICNAIAIHMAQQHHQLLWGQFPAHNWEERSQQAERLCRQYIQQGVDGVFFAPVELASVMFETNARIIGLLHQADIPIVLLDWDIVPFPGRSKFDLVGIDNRRVGCLLAEHFIAKGCRRISFVCRRLSAQTVQARIEGYREAMMRADLGQHVSVCLGDPSDPDFVQELMQPSPPEAIICANDYTAAQLINTLLQQRIKIPQDVRVAGIDDVKYGHLLAVPLTTVHQPCEDIGHTAADTMLQRIATPGMAPRTILFDVTLIERLSSQ